MVSSPGGRFAVSVGGGKKEEARGRRVVRAVMRKRHGNSNSMGNPQGSSIGKNNVNGNGNVNGNSNGNSSGNLYR